MTAQTTARKSRASRAADKAAQDQQQQPEPQDQQPGPADPPDENGTPSSDTRGNEDQDQQPEPTPAAPAKPAPEVPFDLGAGRITFYRPSLTLPDGEVVDCPHDIWGHQLDKHAMKCLRTLARDHGVALAK